MARVFWSMPQELIDAADEAAKDSGAPSTSRWVSDLIRKALPKQVRDTLPEHRGPGRPVDSK